MNRTASSHFLSSDDPRLTAYALGELEGAERDWVATAVASRPELQAAVEEIRRAAEDLKSALASEPLPEVEPVRLPLRAGINGRHVPSAATIVPFPAPAAPAVPRVTAANWVSTKRTHRASQHAYAGIMAMAAACFLMVVFVGERRFSAEEEAAAARRAERVATERARAAAAAAAAAAQSRFVEFTLKELDIASAVLAAPADENEGVETGATYQPAEHRPTSSFPIDVATTSYGDVVRAIAARQLPPVGSIRIEEMLNTFAYDYPGPAEGDAAPFAAALEAADAPWAPDHRLVRIGLKGREDPAGSAATIARNVSIVVEFNPASVRAYRLIGYEKSPLVAQDALSTGRVDAAEVRAGHAVTALYEVIPAAAGDPARLLTVRIAYTTPDGAPARPLEFPLDDRGASFGDASGDFKFAAAVAGFGMILRHPNAGGTLTFGSILAWAEQGAADDATGQRREFVGLVRNASEFLR